MKAPERPPQFVCVGTDRQLHIVDALGQHLQQLTAEMPLSGGPWAMLGRQQTLWSWPAWSPDGTWIAAFCAEGSDTEAAPARLIALSLDGIRQEEWGKIPDGGPVYLQWHPHERVVAVLYQRRDELLLGVLGATRSLRTVESGVPLFFNWQPDGQRLLVHAGARGSAGRLVSRDALGTEEDWVFDSLPGNFCAPVFVGDKAVYVVREEESSALVVSAPDGSEPQTLLHREGLLAILAAPVGPPTIAVSAAADGEGTPYQGIDLVSLDTGILRRIMDEPCLAWFWSPTGTFIVYAQVDRVGNCLRWFRVWVSGGTPEPLGSFWPTRDILFYLHFFDQFVSSHPLISADGRYMVWPGYPAADGQADLSGPPQIYLKDLHDPERPARSIMEGAFAVFAPI